MCLNSLALILDVDDQISVIFFIFKIFKIIIQLLLKNFDHSTEAISLLLTNTTFPEHFLKNLCFESEIIDSIHLNLLTEFCIKFLGIVIVSPFKKLLLNF